MDAKKGVSLFPGPVARWRGGVGGVMGGCSVYAGPPVDGARPLTVGDATARAAFAAAAPASALSIKWAFWTWAPEHPFPTWEALLKAALYVDPVHAELLKLLSARVYRAVPAPGAGTGHVRTSRVALPGGGETTVRVYSPRSAGGVPESVGELPIRLAVSRCRLVERTPTHVLATLARGGVVALWGTAAEVRAGSEGTDGLGVGVVATEVHYFVRHKMGLASRLMCQALVVKVFTSAAVPTRPVCPTPPHTARGCGGREGGGHPACQGGEVPTPSRPPRHSCPTPSPFPRPGWGSRPRCRWRC